MLDGNFLKLGRSESWIAIAVALVVSLGCSEAEQGPDTHPVSGVVTYQGKPAEGVTLTFVPTGEGINSQAITDDAGQFTVTTYYDLGKSSKEGMVADEYKVTAVKLDRESIKTTLSPPKDLLPKKYGSVEDSGLTATVAPGEQNRFEFDLN